jgi:mRNA interferase RelE/StbE
VAQRAGSEGQNRPPAISQAEGQQGELEGLTWRIELSRPAARALERASKPDHKPIERAIDGLGTNPRPPGKLVNAIQGPHDDFLRLRVGDFRILYEVFDADRVVLIHGVIPRKELEEWLRQRR